MIFLLFSALGFFISSIAKIIVISVAATLLIVSVILFICKKTGRYSSLLIFICLVAIILSTLISLVYFNVKALSYEQYYGQERTIRATVTDEIYDSGNLSAYKIRVETLDGEKNPHTAEIKCYYNSSFVVGDRFEVTAIAEGTDGEYPTRYDTQLSRLADGIFITYSSYDESTVKIIDSNVPSISVFFSKINSALSRVLTSSIPGEEGKLASAILLGNRDLLSDITARDFSRAGVSHILAISGLHMSILMGVFMLILKKLRVKTRIIAIIMILLSFTYLALTGFSVSATRSVIMLSLVYLSMLASVPSDPLTSLSIAGVIIILISPGSVLDAGFWMSFSATLGILAYMPACQKFMSNALCHITGFKKLLKIATSAMTLFAASVFAIIPLIIVMCVFIREISFYSVISSALLSLPTAFIIILSLIFLPFAKIPYISYCIASTIRSVAEFMLSYCAKISSIEDAMISLNYSFSYIFAAILGVALLCSLIFRFKNLFISLVPYIAALLVFIGTITIYEFSTMDTVKISYLNCSSDADMVVMSNQGDVVICDIGNGSNKSFNIALNEVYNAHATEVKAVMLTHYENTYPSSLYKLFSTIRVRELWLPTPQTEDDYNKMLPIVEKASLAGVKVYTYTTESTLSAFSFVNIELKLDKISRSKEEIVLLTVYGRKDRFTYVSPAFNESNLLDVANKYFSKSDYVVFGNKGARTHSSYSIPDNTRISAIAFADDIRAANFEHYFADINYFLVPEKINFLFEK